MKKFNNIKHLNIVEGERVRFVLPKTEEDFILMTKWRNDMKYYFFSDLSVTVEQTKEWYKKIILDNSKIFYMIQSYVDPETNKNMKIPVTIGTIGIVNLDEHNNSGEYSWLIIGNKEYQRGGFGKESELLMIDYCFGHLKLNRFYADVLDYNEVVLNLHLKTGFKKEALFRKSVFKDNKYCDVVRFGYLREDYEQRKNDF